jgi:hypothetical protein
LLHTHTHTQNANRYQPHQQAKVKEVETAMIMRALAMEGSVSGEHGVGVGKIAHILAEHGVDHVDLQRAVKRAIDPRNIMNPGKVFILPREPGAYAAACGMHARCAACRRFAAIALDWTAALCHCTRELSGRSSSSSSEPSLGFTLPASALLWGPPTLCACAFLRSGGCCDMPAIYHETEGGEATGTYKHS